MRNSHRQNLLTPPPSPCGAPLPPRDRPPFDQADSATGAGSAALRHSFTPGPWTIGEDAFSEPHPNHAFIWLNAPGTPFVSGHIGKATAHLIKAAPDMYEALEQISARCPPYTGEYADLSEIAEAYSGANRQDYADEAEAFLSAQTGDIARAALAKARGQA